MKALSAVLLCASVLTASAAYADTTYTVDKVTITGSKTVPTQTLLDAIQTHKGSRATQADIVADQDTITKVLGKANVVGGIKTSIKAFSNKHVEVIFALDDQGAQAPVVNHVAAKLRSEKFVGNASLKSADLETASGLKPGDELTNAKMLAAQKAIAAAYSAAKKPVDVNIGMQLAQTKTGETDVTWNITETKTKEKKTRHTEDDRSNLEQ